MIGPSARSSAAYSDNSGDRSNHAGVLTRIVQSTAMKVFWKVPQQVLRFEAENDDERALLPLLRPHTGLSASATAA